MSARTLALPLVLGALAAAPALAAGGSGLSLSPPVVEHAAVAGPVGSVKVGNATGQPMKISVTVHPWVQSANGAAVPNQRVVLHNVRPSIGSFTLADGASQMVSLALVGAPPHGSLYANVDVVGVPTQPTHAPNGLNFEYRLVGSLRLDPLHPSYHARAGGVAVTGTHRSAAVTLAVTNTGNTVSPISGSVHISGARGAVNGTIAPVRILPGATVNVPVLAVAGSLPAGSYKVSASLTVARHRVLVATRRFKLR